MKFAAQKLMVRLPYSRELSLLLVFERTPSGTLRIYVFYNGETLVETLHYKPGRPFSLKCMSYSAYQGVLYVCFGAKHPLYRFRIDEGALVKFNDEVNRVYEKKKQETEIREEFLEKNREDLEIIEDDTVLLEDLTTNFHHQQVVEQVMLENPELRRGLFSFEVLEWPVVSYSPKQLTEMLQVDPEKVNETLQKASEEESEKPPFLLRTSVVAPFASRLWCFGSPANSHQITASAKGDFSDFDVAYPSLVHARNPLSPIIGTFVSETFDTVLWAVPFGEELLIGTTDGIYVLKEGQRDKGEFVKIHKELHMGIAPIRPVVLDKALFFVEGNRKNISCLTWSRERGGYQVHSLTSYADHLFTSSIVRLEAVRTPFNMLFVLLGDGHFNVFTHDADLKILGWTQHFLGGDARIVDCCALPTLKDDMVFFWCVRTDKGKTIEYLEVLRTGQISAGAAASPTLIRQGTFLDCSARLQDEAEIVIDKAVQNLIDNNEFFQEIDMAPQGYALLSRQLHHQVDRDAEQFDIKGFLIDGVPWENLASGVFVEGVMEEDTFIPNKPIEDENIENLLLAAPFIKGSYSDSLFMENYPIDGNFDEPQFLYGKLVGADPLKWESKKFLEKYFKTGRKATLKNIGLWGAFLEGLQELLRFPQDMSIQNVNFYAVTRRVTRLRQILEAIRESQKDPRHCLFIPDCRDFVVTHKTKGRVSKPHINFHSRLGFLRLKEDAIDGFNRIFDLVLRLFKPLLDNIGLRNDFGTIQAFVTHINKTFLEFMAAFEARQGNVPEQISFLQDTSYGKGFWQNAFAFDLVSPGIFATREMVDWLKERVKNGQYKGTPFLELDTERKALFLKTELGNLLEEKEEHIKIRPQTHFVPPNMNIALMDKTRIILDVCASLNVEMDYALAVDVLGHNVKDGNITPALKRRRKHQDGEGEEGGDDKEKEDISLSQNFGSEESQDSEGPEGSQSSLSENKDEEEIIFFQDDDDDLNKAIEGGEPEPIWGRDLRDNPQHGYDNLMLELYARMNTVRNYIERHYLLLSDQWGSEKNLDLWAEKNTFRFFKYCFLDLKNMALYHDLFKTVSLETYTDLVQADSGERTVFTVPFLNLFPPDKLMLVADNGFYEQGFTIKGNEIKLTKPIKAFSMGFNYTSVLKLFPLAFNEEVDSIPKRNVTLGIKVYNTKDGWVEEHQEGGAVVAHSLRGSVLPHNHLNYHASDRGYLVKEVAAVLAPPYQSGWLEIPMKEGIRRDVCVSITVNTPAPFTLLKVTTKAQLLDRYKV